MSRHGKKKFAKRKPHRTGRVLLFVLLFLLAIPALAGAWFLSTFDINAWRDQIAEAVSHKTGREIKLGGPILWAFSLEHGASVSVSDAQIGNPGWASRPDMARIGKAKLHINLKALLERKLDIIAFELSGADVQLETSASGVGNWIFKKKEDTKSGEEKRSGENKPTVEVSLREVKILQSRFGFVGKDGKVTILDVPDLWLTENEEGIHARFKGSVASVPVTLSLLGGKLESMSGNSWPFALQASYAHARIDAKGKARDALKRVVFDSLNVESKTSKLSAEGDLSFEGSRPFLRGKVEAEKLDPDDFLFTPRPGKAAGVILAGKPKAERIFNREPLDLKSFQRLDAELDLTVADLAYGPLPLKDAKATLSLKKGLLLVSPLSVGVAGSRIEGQTKLDASGAEAQLALVLKGSGLEFAKLFDFSSLGDIISGKIDMDMDFSSSGRNSYELAARSNGKINLLMDTGTVSSSGLKSIAGELVDIFLPGVRSLASPGINCMAARYKIVNGLVETEGLLIDMDNTTVAGVGTINLPDEHISMSLRTRPKAVGLGAIVPPMKIYGTLASPEFTVDTGRALQKVAGLLTEAATESGVPNMLHIDGKNDCAVTLDNPALAARKNDVETTKPLDASSGSLTDVVKDIGGNLLKGIGRGILGN